jgi:hypothetical protein
VKDKLKLTTGIKRKHDGNQSKHGRTKKAEKPAVVCHEMFNFFLILLAAGRNH